MLGRFTGEDVENAAFSVSAMCYRVPVIEGHTEAVSVTLRGNPSPDAVAEAFRNWRGDPAARSLHSAPEQPVRVHAAEDRPQVRIDVEKDFGMSVHVGRVRPCRLLGIKFALLGHNTERGAAKGMVHVAEYLHKQGLL